MTQKLAIAYICVKTQYVTVVLYLNSDSQTWQSESGNYDSLIQNKAFTALKVFPDKPQRKKVTVILNEAVD